MFHGPNRGNSHSGELPLSFSSTNSPPPKTLVFDFLFTFSLVPDLNLTGNETAGPLRLTLHLLVSRPETQLGLQIRRSPRVDEWMRVALEDPNEIESGDQQNAGEKQENAMRSQNSPQFTSFRLGSRRWAPLCLPRIVSSTIAGAPEQSICIQLDERVPKKKKLNQKRKIKINQNKNKTKTKLPQRLPKKQGRAI